MKTLSISVIQSDPNWYDCGQREVVKFSDGKEYEAFIICGNGDWDCTLRLLSSQRTVTSPLRRKMVLDYLGLKSVVTRKERTHIDNLRRDLRKYGFMLQKSRVSKLPHAANHGGYRVRNGNGETALGHWYSATLEQVEEFLAAKAAECGVRNGQA